VAKEHNFLNISDRSSIFPFLAMSSFLDCGIEKCFFVRAKVRLDYIKSGSVVKVLCYYALCFKRSKSISRDLSQVARADT